MNNNLKPCPNYSKFLFESKNNSVDYSLTVTITGPLRKKDAEDQYDELKEIVNKIFINSLAVTGTVTAEFHKDFSVHLHGIVKVNTLYIPPRYVNSPNRWLIDQFKRSHCIGRIECLQTVNYDLWVRYIMKDIDVMNKIISRPAIMIDGYSLREGILKYIKADIEALEYDVEIIR